MKIKPTNRKAMCFECKDTIKHGEDRAYLFAGIYHPDCLGKRLTKDLLAIANYKKISLEQALIIFRVSAVLEEI